MQLPLCKCLLFDKRTGFSRGGGKETRHYFIIFFFLLGLLFVYLQNIPVFIFVLDKCEGVYIKISPGYAHKSLSPPAEIATFAFSYTNISEFLYLVKCVRNTIHKYMYMFILLVRQWHPNRVYHVYMCSRGVEKGLRRPLTRTMSV